MSLGPLHGVSSRRVYATTLADPVFVSAVVVGALAIGLFVYGVWAFSHSG
jgi:hypothetical protein